MDRESMLARIRRNIETYGVHVYLIAPGPLPRYAYTIGSSETHGREFVLAGAAAYSGRQAKDILEAATKRWRPADDSLVVPDVGIFDVRRCDPTWVKLALLGAIDYYGGEIQASQLVPRGDMCTIDVPDMTSPWTADSQSVWALLDIPWPYQAPKKSIAMTNLAAMNGASITEAARWENDYWEMFAGAGSEVSQEEALPVPIGVLLAQDVSLGPVIELQVGSAIRRADGDASWSDWTPRSG